MNFLNNFYTAEMNREIDIFDIKLIFGKQIRLKMKTLLVGLVKSSLFNSTKTPGTI